jgi:chloride channel protein, CIC family
MTISRTGLDRSGGHDGAGAAKQSAPEQSNGIDPGADDAGAQQELPAAAIGPAPSDEHNERKPWHGLGPDAPVLKLPRRGIRLSQAEITRVGEWLHTSPTGLLGLALITGMGAGLGAILFRYLILWFTELFSGYKDYSAVGHVSNPLVPALGVWFVVLVPAIGGLIYGPLVDRFAREARGHGVPEVMLAVAERGGRIAPQVAVIKSLASALCIGSGGSVGREGPIVQIGSALGSTLGQLVRLPEARLRLLVACGAAGGISATFNAPIAGVFFGLELILRDFETESFGLVVLASITADVIGRAAFGTQAFLALPAFHVVSTAEYGLYAGLGLLAAVVGVGFTRVLYGMEDLCDQFWHGPEWLRPAAGGLVLGLLLLAVPQMYGVGYPVLENAVRGQYVVWFLLALMLAKIAATSLTIGIGGSGGVFAPSLFIGAMLGSAYGAGVHQLLPSLTAPAGAYGLVGMGAVFAGATRAPITAVIIMFELTGDYTIILPLMCAIVLATGLSSRLSRDTIYTLKLRRRGIDILRGRAANLMEVMTVGEAMRPLPETVPHNLPLNQLIERFTTEHREALPVVNELGAYRGTVTVHQVEQAMRDNALDSVAGDLVQNAPALSTDQTLEQALSLLARSERQGLPVLTADTRRVCGWLSHRDMLLAYNTRLQQSVQQAAAQNGGAAPQEQEAKDTASSAPAADRPTELPVLSRLQGYRIVDVEIGRRQSLASHRLADVAWPPHSLVIAVRRDGRTFVPQGSTPLKVSDRLTVLVPADHAGGLVDLGLRESASMPEPEAAKEDA